MSHTVLKNLTLAKRLGVSHPTIGRWIQSALQKENNLQLEEVNKRFYILDNAHNEAELSRLKEHATKFRNKVGYQKLIVNPELYQDLTHTQLVELITNLEYQHTIPLKFTYLNVGADIWDNFVHDAVAQARFYMGQAPRLVEANLDYLVLKLASYKNVSIIEVGPGNGYSIKPIIDKLREVNMGVRYQCIDISPRMNQILEENFRAWYPDMVVESSTGDMDYMVIRDRLFANKLEHEESCNLIVLFGGTIGNVYDRHRVLKNFYDSMGENDFFMLDNPLDTPGLRANFQTLEKPSYNAILRWIPEKLGLTVEMYEKVHTFDEDSKTRIGALKLTKDIDMVFQLPEGEKTIRFYQGQEIRIWQHFSHTLNGLIRELQDAYFEISHLSCYPGNTHVLALCQASK